MHTLKKIVVQISGTHGGVINQSYLPSEEGNYFRLEIDNAGNLKIQSYDHDNNLITEKVYSSGNWVSYEAVNEMSAL